MKKNNVIPAIMILCLVAILSVGVTLAYLFSGAAIKNTFVIGDLTITLEEPNYGVDGVEPVGGTEIIPLATIPKDPTVTLEGVDAYVFMQVMISETLAGLIEDIEIGEDWKRIDGDTDGSYLYNIYIYKGNEIGPDLYDYTAQAGTLPPLFESVVMKDFSDDEADSFRASSAQTIIIKAAAIQCANYTIEEATAAVGEQWGTINPPTQP